MQPRFFLLAALFAVPGTSSLAAEATGMFNLRSTDIAPGSTIGAEHVYKGFGCSGGNRSPELVWSHPPAGTKSFAVTVFDPDAPTGKGWWHWLVVNIPADVNELPADAGNAAGTSLPKGAKQVRSDFGTPAYGGPCPPAGDKPHHYVFTVYALKTQKLDVPGDATAASAGDMINANQIGKATFTAMYGR
jgi:Raf kinase inhibitor-like YbhB/YbcL family protein